jgi:hypothetical protein
MHSSGKCFISLWAGDIATPEDLPSHLGVLYKAIGFANFLRDPRVCEELERVPVAELIEPFLPRETELQAAAAAAERQSLRLATTVVAIYTRHPPKEIVIQPSGCELRFIGSFQK